MDQALFVHVVDAWTHLYEEVKGGVLTEGPFLPDEVEQIGLGGILQTQVDLLLVLKTGVEAAEVLVIKAFLNSDFADQGFFYFGVG